MIGQHNRSSKLSQSTQPTKQKARPKTEVGSANGRLARPSTELVIITGMSGSGKASVMKAFEDLGFYCVDNLPIDLILRFAELVKQSSEIERAALVGVSMGARVALEVALARPQLVSALVLVGAAMPAEGWSEAVRSYGAEEARLFEAGDLGAAAELNVRFWVDGVGRDPDEVDAEVRRKVSEMQRRAYEHWLDVGDAAQERKLVEDAGTRAHEVRAPALIVVGEYDQADCIDTAERLAREIPSARLERMAATAHAPSMERPKAFDALVVPFLAEHA